MTRDERERWAEAARVAGQTVSDLVRVSVVAEIRRREEARRQLEAVRRERVPAGPVDALDELLARSGAASPVAPALPLARRAPQ